ncbi:Gustatory receptor 81, partial [Hyalella azteca]
MDSLSDKLNQRRMLLWQYRCLRMMGVAPYKYSNGRYYTHQVFRGLSIAVQITLAALVLGFNFCPGQHENTNNTQLETPDVYASIKNYWACGAHVVLIVVVWHFLTSSKEVVIIVRTIMKIKTTVLPISWPPYAMVIICCLDLSFAFYKHYQEHVNKLYFVLSFLVAHFIFIAYVLISIFLFTIMEIVTSDIEYFVKSLCSIKFTSMRCMSNSNVRPINGTIHETDKMTKRFGIIDGNSMYNKIQSKAKKGFGQNTESSMPHKFGDTIEFCLIAELDIVRKVLIQLRHTVSRVHKAFSVAALGVVIYEQVDLFFLILYGMFENTTSDSVGRAIFFSLPAAFQLWLVLNSQTAYVKMCEESKHRVRKLAAEVGRMGPQFSQEAWQIRSIHAELKRMPRF